MLGPIPYSWTQPPQIATDEDARLAAEAKAFIAAGKVTKVPYAGERYSLKFDRRTFSVVRGQKRFSEKLAWSDVQNGMHFIRRATANEMRMMYTPEFSKNDDLLRLAIAQEGWDYARHLIAGTEGFYDDLENARSKSFVRVPEGFVRNREALESLCNRATAEMKKQVHGTAKGQVNQFIHISWCEAHGGYIALRARVAYLAWRAAKDSATIAKEMSLSWHGVRQMLCRLCESARDLGLETFPRHHSYQGQRN